MKGQHDGSLRDALFEGTIGIGLARCVEGRIRYRVRRVGSMEVRPHFWPQASERTPLSCGCSEVGTVDHHYRLGKLTYHLISTVDFSGGEPL